jgi:hypothetical protein
MGETEYKCADATRKELCDAARKHYDEISIEAMHYSTTIAHAIDAYEREPDLKQQLTTAQENEAMLRSALSELVLAAINLSKYDDFSEPIPDCPHCNTINPKEFNDVRMEFDKVLSKVIGGE